MDEFFNADAVSCLQAASRRKRPMYFQDNWKGHRGAPLRTRSRAGVGKARDGIAFSPIDDADSLPPAVDLSTSGDWQKSVFPATAQTPEVVVVTERTDCWSAFTWLVMVVVFVGVSVLASSNVLASRCVQSRADEREACETLLAPLTNDKLSKFLLACSAVLAGSGFARLLPVASDAMKTASMLLFLAAGYIAWTVPTFHDVTLNGEKITNATFGRTLYLWLFPVVLIAIMLKKIHLMQ